MDIIDKPKVITNEQLVKKIVALDALEKETEDVFKLFSSKPKPKTLKLKNPPIIECSIYFTPLYYFKITFFKN